MGESVKGEGLGEVAIHPLSSTSTPLPSIHPPPPLPLSECVCHLRNISSGAKTIQLEGGGEEEEIHNEHREISD
ncbi:hypothetical protein Pcinc_036744 [Petrolisthes cinctipes]|uniref:Uncharacterized protein n=1 Tax=Petrolisthes cinctipes TaxID=88211 RepID=A0AAE1BUD8_PETCI|nr:hypothetical protein Pcinc_036744 [Petrolisthes cinctipes]